MSLVNYASDGPAPVPQVMPLDIPLALLSELLVVTIGSLIASFINAAFATGGIYITLASSSFIFPLSVAIPLQSAFSFASLAARIGYFRAHIQWSLVKLFATGSVVGVAIGSSVFVALPEAMIALSFGVFLLLLIWGPSVSKRWHQKKAASDNYSLARTEVTKLKSVQINDSSNSNSIKSGAEPDRSGEQSGGQSVEKKCDNKNQQQTTSKVFLPLGVAHSFLGTVFGVGSLLQPAILRTQLDKLQITGTLAACLLIMDVFKLTGYVALGFDYSDYWLHILCATIAGFTGTIVGKRVTHRVSEQTFRFVFKCLITLVAIRLIYRGLVLW